MNDAADPSSGKAGSGERGPTEATGASIDAQRATPLAWTTVVKRIVIVVVGGAAIYLVLPQITHVLASWPRLSRLNPIWFVAVVAAETAHFTCTIGLQRVALRTRGWFAVITAQLAGNAITNILPAGDVAGAAVEFRMLATSGIDPDTAVGGLSAFSLLGVGGLLALPIFVLPAILFGTPVSRGLAEAAFVGIGGFVLFAGFGAAVLATDQPLAWFGRATQRIRNWIFRRHPPMKGLDGRLLRQRDEIRSVLGKKWRDAVLLSSGRLAFDYLCLLAALRATGVTPNPHSCSWPMPLPESSGSFPSPPEVWASSKQVSAACSSSLASMGEMPFSPPLHTGWRPTGSRYRQVWWPTYCSVGGTELQTQLRGLRSLQMADPVENTESRSPMPSPDAERQLRQENEHDPQGVKQKRRSPAPRVAQAARCRCQCGLAGPYRRRSDSTVRELFRCLGPHEQPRYMVVGGDRRRRRGQSDLRRLDLSGCIARTSPQARLPRDRNDDRNLEHRARRRRCGSRNDLQDVLLLRLRRPRHFHRCHHDRNLEPGCQVRVARRWRRVVGDQRSSDRRGSGRRHRRRGDHDRRGTWRCGWNSGPKPAPAGSAASPTEL